MKVEALEFIRGYNADDFINNKVSVQCRLYGKTLFLVSFHQNLLNNKTLLAKYIHRKLMKSLENVARRN